MILDRPRPRQGSGRFFSFPGCLQGGTPGAGPTAAVASGPQGRGGAVVVASGSQGEALAPGGSCRCCRSPSSWATRRGRTPPPFIPATERSGASPALREQRTQGSHSSFVGAHPHGRPRGIERHAPPNSGDGAQRGEPRSTRAGATKALRRSKPRPVPCLGKAPAPVHRPPHSPGLAAALAASEEARRARVASRWAM